MHKPPLPIRNTRGSAMVETAIVIVLFTALTWGIIEIFLMAWLKLAATEAAYHAGRARAVYLDGNRAKSETLIHWPWRLSAFLLANPRVSWSTELAKVGQNFHEVTVTTRIDSPRFLVLRNWAHAQVNVQAQQTRLMSPGGLDSMEKSYLNGELDP